MTLRAVGVALAGALATLACGAGGEPSRDGPPRWSLSEEPLVAIGQLQGEAAYLFEHVAGVVLLPGGGVAVADRGSASLRVYDADGSLQVEMGRQGEGPGEFEYINRLLVFGSDTLAVYDGSLFRLTTFARNGTLLKALNLRPAPGSRPEVLVGRFVDGDLAVSWIDLGPRDRSKVTPDVMPIARFGADGVFIDGLATATGMVRATRGPVPFSPRLHSFVYGDSIFFSNGVSEITVVDASGAVARTIPLPLPRLDPGEARAQLAARVEELGARGELPRFTSAEDVAEAGEGPVPAASELLLDDRGRFWLKPYDPARDSHLLSAGAFERRAGGVWWVLERDGSTLALVPMPDRFTPMDVRGGLVAGVIRDDLDVERVLVFEVVTS